MSEARNKKAKHLFLFLRVAVVLCGIVWGILWLSREHRWSNLLQIFHRMNIGVFVCALGVYVLGQIIIGLRWWLLLRAQSVVINLSAAVRLHFLGLFYNNFMPSSVGGDLIRAWYVTRHTDRRFQAALSVFVDRLIGLLSTLVIALFFYSLFLRGRSGAIMPQDERQAGFLDLLARYKRPFLWIAVLLAVLFWGFLSHHQGRVLLKTAWSSACLYGVRIVRKFKDAIVLYSNRPLTILGVFWLTVLMQLMTITGFWFLGRNLGVETDIKYYYVFFTLTWVLGAVPVSIGGAVVVEVLLASMFINLAGAAEEPASALALSQRAVWMLASLPGAAIHLIGAHLPKHFSIDYDKAID